MPRTKSDNTSSISLPQSLFEFTAPNEAGDAPEGGVTCPVTSPTMGPTVGLDVRPGGAAPGATALPTGVVLAGDLAVFPLLDILGLLTRQQHTGLLTIESEDLDDENNEVPIHVQIYLKAGRVAFAQGGGLPQLRIGRFIEEIEAATASEIDEIDAAPRNQDTPLALRMNQLGYLSGDDLRHVLTRQTQELIFAALRLTHGRFALHHLATTVLRPSAKDRAVGSTKGLELDVDLTALLLEGCRRTHEWHMSELEPGARYLGIDDRMANADRLGLSAEEQTVLHLCTGRHTLNEIAHKSRLRPDTTQRLLTRLLTLGLIRRQIHAAAFPDG